MGRMHTSTIDSHTHTLLCGYGLSTGPTEGLSLRCQVIGHPWQPTTTVLLPNQ